MAVTSILSASALTTYARAKARLITNGQNAINDDEHQNEIESMINAASDGAVRFCGREFHRVSRAERHAPPEGERLVVDVTPVATSPAPTATLDGATVALAVEDDKLGFLRVTGGWGGKDYEEEVPKSVALDTRPGTGERVAVVTYTGGWVTPSQATEQSPRTLPWDIEEAVLIAVAFLWKMMRGGYAGDVMPETNSAIGRGEGGILPDISMKILRPYQRNY